jgi:hypothetical protein
MIKVGVKIKVDKYLGIEGVKVSWFIFDQTCIASAKKK